MTEMAEQVLAAQPFSALVGARLVAFGDGEAVLELDIADRHRQQFGTVHGGVVAYLADNALTFACGAKLGTDIVTSGVTVSYLAAPRDGVLRATARVDAADARRAAATVHIDEIAADGSSRRCAVGQGTASRRRAEPSTVAVARALYDALAARDVDALVALLAPGFTGRISDGMPLGVGGHVAGPDQMLAGVWGTVAAEYDIAPVPDEFVTVDDQRVIVFGSYRGRHLRTGRRVAAAFAHDLQIRDDVIVSLVQITDTESWHLAAAS